MYSVFIFVEKIVFLLLRIGGSSENGEDNWGRNTCYWYQLLLMSLGIGVGLARGYKTWVLEECYGSWKHFKIRNIPLPTRNGGENKISSINAN